MKNRLRVGFVIIILLLLSGVFAVAAQASGIAGLVEPITPSSTINTTAVPASSVVDIGVEGTYRYDFAYEVLEIMNQERVARGRAPLTMDQQLLDAGMLRAAECSVFYSHTRPNGSSCFTVLRGSHSGENVAAGYSTPAAVMGGWMNSPGHFENIVRTTFVSVGIGCYEDSTGVLYWAQVFDNLSPQGAGKPGNSRRAVPIASQKGNVAPNLVATNVTIKAGDASVIKAKIINQGWKSVYTVPTGNSYRYSSRNNAVATVNTEGEIMGVSGGSTVIDVLYQDGTATGASINVTTTPLDPSSVKIEQPASTTIETGRELQLKTIFSPAPAQATVTWRSSNTAIAAITENGLVIPRKAGTTTITATTHNGEKALLNITVVEPSAAANPGPSESAPPPTPTELRLDRSGTVNLDFSETLALNAIVLPVGAQSAIIWESSNTAIVSVSSAGIVTPKKVGTATITATSYNGKKATVAVKVADLYKPTGVKLSRTGTVDLPLDSTIQLTATLLPTGAMGAVTWKSSNAAIASISDNGTVTPKKEGTATITATARNGKKATVKVKVVDPYKPTGVKLNMTGTITLPMDQTLALSVSLIPATARSPIGWKSSSAAVATVSNGVVTPKKEGTATITAITGNGKKATVKVKVVDPYKPTNVSIVKPATIVLSVGDMMKLDATLAPASARSGLTWKSSSAKIMSVDSAGNVTALGKGSATITVTTANKKSAKIKLTVQ